MTTTMPAAAATASSSSWTAYDPEQRILAKHELEVWPLDSYNAELLNQVHPLGYTSSTNQPHQVYDIIAIGAGAGGLVTSKQSGRRGAKSAMISAKLAGGDCLNVGCVPSKALLRVSKAIAEVKRASAFGIISLNNNNGPIPIQVDFPAIMERMRRLRTTISPNDGHQATAGTGAHVYQGFGKFTSPNTIQVNGQTLTFKKAVIATGGRPTIPNNIPGLVQAPYTTNEILFNLQTLPPRMVILGSGVIALEMAQCFANFGSQVTVVGRTDRLFASKYGDEEAAQVIQSALEQHSGVTFVSGTTLQVTTLRDHRIDKNNIDDSSTFPLMKVTVQTNGSGGPIQDLECECLLVAMGRSSNVENMGLETAGIQYQVGLGVQVNDNLQTSNPNVYAVGDAAAGVPRLTHVSGEMAKMAIQNALFGDDWKLSSLVIPAVAYTEPEYATVGLYSQALAEQQGIPVDVYRAGLEDNDRAILESSTTGFCKILVKKGTDEIVGCTIVADRAGEMINEVTLAMKNKLGLYAIGRNIHAYPTTGEAVMACGIQYINSKVLAKLG